MRDRIFTELRDAKFKQIYSELSLDHYRSVSNFFSSIVSIFSTGGVVMGLSFWKTGTILPLIACGIITVIQIIRILMPRYIPSETQLKKIDKIIDFYFKYYNELEKIWYDYDKDRINDEEAQARFFKLKNTEATTLQLVNEVIRHNKKNIKNKAAQEARSYLTIFYT